ncbi:MAG: flagellar motor protein MotD [Gammaproteobacteria bacterium]|nr:flagellar motor protein MotD [Gammaproteobacteria bacterium]
MARRREPEHEGNHEAWAIPYGDLVTLLLAFFVVMYAISSVNEGKYRILSDSLVAAFRAAPKSLEPVQVGDLSRSRHEVQTRPSRTLVPLETDQPSLAMLERTPELDKLQRFGLSLEELEQAAALIEEINEAIVEAIEELVDEELVRVRRDRFWLEIEINTSVLFASGSAEIATGALPIVDRLGGILSGTPTRIYVEGHSDELPIATPAFPSNWELSAARAASVVRMFAAEGVEPQRMAVVGFGEFQPVADNDTPEGRRFNRRVVIVVMAGRERIKTQRTLEALGLSAKPAPAAPETTS